MDEWWELLKKAHEEVMNATGWGALLSGEGKWWSASPSGAVQQGWKEVTAFIAAVDWWEPFFTYLAAFHIVVATAVVLLTWGASPERLIAVDVLLLLLIWCSSYLNDIGRSYAPFLFVEKGANYFDASGLFVTVTYALPLFLLVLWLQGRIIVRLLKLMVAVKRKQMLSKRRQHTVAPEGSAQATTVREK
uniref:Uncharacterized protein TCIL3000_11_16360 n=1 Tax=Trypanosoma congolense (strain IL3000) TaxID=1068625 RepID=G0V3A1_TRYCI|nr:unnamed protein product [Trypanosoma congolense IL3000]